MQLEIDAIAEAHRQDMLTCPYVFDPDHARAMVEAGADVIVPHVGLTTKGSIGAETALTLDDCAKMVQAIRDEAIKADPDIICLCHGGPIAEPEDARDDVAVRQHQPPRVVRRRDRRAFEAAPQHVEHVHRGAVVSVARRAEAEALRHAARPH